MSAIVHRCECGHLEQYHAFKGGRANPAVCSYGWCGTHIVASGPSILIPMYNANGEVIDRVAAPGSRLAQNADGTADVFGRLCDCDECQALFSQLVGDDCPSVGAPW